MQPGGLLNSFIGSAQPWCSMRQVAHESLSKFQRYRVTQRTKGMRLVRIWVPDPGLASFRLEAKRQGRLLRHKPEEQDALAFIEQTIRDEKG